MSFLSSPPSKSMAHTKLLSACSGSRHISLAKQNKKLFLVLFASLLVIAAVVICLFAGKQNPYITTTSHSHIIIKSSCSNTLYPELCFSAIAESPNLSSKVTNPEDVIVASLNITIAAAKNNSNLVHYVTRKRGILTKRQQIALHDCLTLLEDTIDEVHQAVSYLTKKSLSERAHDLKTLLSSAITNQDTCLDGFSHSNADKKVREELLEAEIHLRKLCSNGLAMIRHQTDKDMAVQAKGRKLQEEYNYDQTGWPKWLSARDRRLLRSGKVVPDIVVAADGSGNFTTVDAAVEAAPRNSDVRYVIKIKAGVYRENVEVPSAKRNIMFLGAGRNRTIITGNRSVGGGDATTFNSSTVAANGAMFLAKGVTFINTAGPQNHQAVAFRSSSDFSAFYKCIFVAFQDTLYVHRSRQFYYNCTVKGTVDFIFGNAEVVFQHCDIQARKPGRRQKNMVTAHGRSDPGQTTGIVIQKSKISATKDLEPEIENFPSYLGRPWQKYSRTVVMQSEISSVIHPEGWHRWNQSDFGKNTCEYREYHNFGSGANTSKRVNWKGYKEIKNATEAFQYTAREFISGESWLNSTGFPYFLGL